MTQEITFAGSTPGEPWSQVGYVVGKVLAPHGYTVEVLSETSSQRNIPWMMKGGSPVGATSENHLAVAALHRPPHENSRLDDLVAIATLKRPAFVGLAIRRNLGVTSLRQLADLHYPVRYLASDPTPGGLTDLVFRHYGLQPDQIVQWGGKHYRWSGREGGNYIREGVIDVLLGNCYSGFTPHGRFWYEATVLMDLLFLDLEPELVDTLARELLYTPAVMPEGLFPQVDRDVNTVAEDGVVIYCRRDLPHDFALLVARSLDEHSDLFRYQRSPLYYLREAIGVNEYLPLHPAVEAYYRSRGYPVQTPSVPAGSAVPA